MRAIQFIRNLTTGQIDVMGFGVTIGISVLVLGASYSINAQRAKNFVEEQKTLTARLTYLTDIQQALGQGEETLGSLDKGMGDLDRRLPQDMDVQSFYKSVTDFAQRHNVLISELRPGTPVDEEDHVKMPVSLKAQATFENFHAFLFDVTGLPRLSKLESLSMNVADTPNLCNVDVTMNIYAAQRKASDETH